MAYSPVALACLILLASARAALANRPLSLGADHTAVQHAPAGCARTELRYIVVFKERGVDVAAATARLLRHVRRQSARASGAVLAAAATADDADAAGNASFEFVTSLAGEAPGEGGGKQPAAAAAASSALRTVRRGRSHGVQGIVVRASPRVAEAIRASGLASAVFEDLEVTAAVAPPASCADARALSAGTIAPKTTTLSWAGGCLTNTSRAVWVGQRCGTGLSRIAYTAVFAVSRTNGALRRVNGQPCVLVPNTKTAVWTRNVFGSGCGAAPTVAKGLPTSVCSTPMPASPDLDCAVATPAPSRLPDGSSGAGLVQAQLALKAGAAECGGKPVRRLTYFGAACGAGGQLVRWTAAFAPDGCALRPRATDAKFTADVFGTGCGVPPGAIDQPASGVLCAPPTVPAIPSPQLPATPASPSPQPSAASPSPSPQPPVQDASPSPQPPVQEASPSPQPPVQEASPSPQPPVQEASPSPQPPVQEASPSPQPPVQEASPSPQPVDSSSPSPRPDLPIPSPSPAPTAWARLQRVPLTSGDQVPSGVARIEAASAVAGVVSTAGLPVDQQVLVGVVDSGIDAEHPDLLYGGGLSWVDNSLPDVDAFGHGTHVAGIIGARNQGSGVVGVSPGTPVFSLKVLDDRGKGSLSGVIAAVKWAITQGAQVGVRVLNLSLAAYVDPSTPAYAEAYSTVCEVLREASDAGIFIAVAAGNYGASMRGYLPASCPTVAAVTAVDAAGQQPWPYSNFLPDNDATDEERSHVIAAPGEGILSTISFARDPSGYRSLSGTSMAAPHVAALAANCRMGGACAPGLTGVQQLAVLQEAARQRLKQPGPGYGFRGDATSTVNAKYFGYLAWAAF